MFFLKRHLLLQIYTAGSCLFKVKKSKVSSKSRRDFTNKQETVTKNTLDNNFGSQKVLSYVGFKSTILGAIDSGVATA